MTRDDILNGRLICLVGVAPFRPAEFVIFRVFQHTAEAHVKPIDVSKGITTRFIRPVINTVLCSIYFARPV
jgi:hypothetical protein